MNNRLRGGGAQVDGATEFMATLLLGEAADRKQAGSYPYAVGAR